MRCLTRPYSLQSDTRAKISQLLGDFTNRKLKMAEWIDYSISKKHFHLHLLPNIPNICTPNLLTPFDSGRPRNHTGSRILKPQSRICMYAIRWLVCAKVMSRVIVEEKGLVERQSKTPQQEVNEVSDECMYK